MSVAAYLNPRLTRLSKKYKEALSRVEQGGDEEAIHDLRVALRRLRSLLKPVGSIYGVFLTHAVRSALKIIADATGELRDEEVLAQTIAVLSLSPRGEEEERAVWLQGRRSYEANLRDAFLELIASGSARHAIALLDALLLLPVDPACDLPAVPFAMRVVARAERRMNARLDTDPSDVEALHRLRILAKRLRYAAEGFSDALPPEMAAKAKIAEQFQKILGEIHDLDIASTIVQNDLVLSPELQLSLLLSLKKARAEAIVQWEIERSAFKASLPPPSKKKKTRSKR